MKHELPQLPYAYDALEPYIDTKTMEIHHAKHHQTYVTKLNEALGLHPEMADKPLEELLRSLDAVPADIRGAIRNHGGGHLNHSFFWGVMCKPDLGPKKPEGISGSQIVSAFGGFDKLKEEFTKAALGVFGSGWAWLVRDKNMKLAVTTTPNQDTPVSAGMTPILGLDVWEHAYYLKYQNKRADYIEAWWQVVNWHEVEQRFESTQ